MAERIRQCQILFFEEFLWGGNEHLVRPKAVPEVLGDGSMNFGDFFTGCIVHGVSRIHANSDDIPWENKQKSIIIQVFRRFVQIMMNFRGFSQGMSSEFA